MRSLRAFSPARVDCGRAHRCDRGSVSVACMNE
jgi:hypothetical protein